MTLGGLLSALTLAIQDKSFNSWVLLAQSGRVCDVM
jgi:high-affinity K+ transport system ATPase subunit B